MTTRRYSRVREIGRGGMGAVWLGEDEVLGRPVALKRVGVVPGGAEPDLARAEREARLAASLNHPHVVAVFDLVAEGEEHWLVMEYVEGTSLAELIRREGPLPPEHAARLLEQTADALTAAHAAGIVHRDVKPSNILVTAEGQAKLTDFGIARATADATLTQTGLVTGSPAYLSPEVATGRSATSASDVWALGATLFHCLAGRPPYEVGDNVLGAMYRIVHEDPPRLEEPGWLGPLVEHTLASDPEDRWSMAEVRDFLRAGADRAETAVLPGQGSGEPDQGGTVPEPPTAVHPPVTPATPVPDGGSTSPHQRWPWAVLAAVVLALSVGAFALGLTNGRDDGAEQEAAPETPSATPAAAGEGEGEDPGTTEETPEPEDTGQPEEGEPISAEEMQAFVTGYLSTVTEDPRATWKMLTPEFQAASGNYGSYRGFWSTIEDARVDEVRPDPASSSVSYDVTYEMANGETVSDSTTLQLVRAEGTVKIAAEG